MRLALFNKRMPEGELGPEASQFVGRSENILILPCVFVLTSLRCLKTSAREASFEHLFRSVNNSAYLEFSWKTLAEKNNKKSIVSQCLLYHRSKGSKWD